MSFAGSSAALSVSQQPLYMLGKEGPGESGEFQGLPKDLELFFILSLSSFSIDCSVLLLRTSCELYSKMEGFVSKEIDIQS